MNNGRKNGAMGWTAVGISTMFSSFWAYWGIIENFHEGWFHESPWENIKMMFGQYLSPMVGFLVIALFSIRFRRAGSVLHLALAIFIFWYFGGIAMPAAFLFIGIPLISLSGLYWFGSIEPKKWAYGLAIGLPVLTLLVGVPSAIRVSQRIDDRNYGQRTVEGNGVTLMWAGEGPGFPERGGLSWDLAKEQCLRLSADGTTLSPEPQGIWRLPSVDEAVRSLALHNQNSGGIWNGDSRHAAYDLTPDKESPLWRVHSQVIYWWTGTAVDDRSAYMIAYDGKVWPRDKRFAPDYFSFRCVRTP